MFSEDILKSRKKLLLEDLEIQEAFTNLTYGAYTVEKAVLKKVDSLKDVEICKLINLDKKCMEILLEMLEIIKQEEK